MTREHVLSRAGIVAESCLFPGEAVELIDNDRTPALAFRCSAIILWNSVRLSVSPKNFDA